MPIPTEKETYKLLYSKLKTILPAVNVSFAIPDISDSNSEYVWISHVDSGGFYYVDGFALITADVHVLAPTYSKAVDIATTIESSLHKQSLGAPNIMAVETNSLWFIEEVENTSFYHYVITFVFRSVQ